MSVFHIETTKPHNVDYNFTLNSNRKFRVLESSKSMHALGNLSTKEQLEVWGFSNDTAHPSLKLRSFSYDLIFTIDKTESFLFSLFNSKQVVEHIVEDTQVKPVTHIGYKPLTTNSTTLGLLDVFMTSSIVPAHRLNTGEVEGFKIMGKVVSNSSGSGEVYVDDKFRSAVIIKENSEDWDSLFEVEDSKSVTNEFLFHILHRLACGGGILNQYSYNILNYKEVARIFYKDCVVPQFIDSNAGNKRMHINSYVFQILSLNNGNCVIFSDYKNINEQSLNTFHRKVEEDFFNFLYIVINPSRKECVIVLNVQKHAY